MFENDYIVRTIHDMVRMIVKLIFGIDTEAEDYELDGEAEEAYQKLMDAVQEGHLNEAENQLSDLIETEEMEYLKVGLLFYEKLNRLDDKALSEMDYSREEISEGIRNLLEEYGYAGLAAGLK